MSANNRNRETFRRAFVLLWGHFHVRCVGIRDRSCYRGAFHRRVRGICLAGTGLNSGGTTSVSSWTGQSPSLHYASGSAMNASINSEKWICAEVHFGLLVISPVLLAVLLNSTKMLSPAQMWASKPEPYPS